MGHRSLDVKWNPGPRAIPFDKQAFVLYLVKVSIRFDF